MTSHVGLKMSGMTSPRSRAFGGPRSLTSKIIVFFITSVAVFTLAVTLLFPLRQKLNNTALATEVNYDHTAPATKLNHYDHAAPVVEHLAHPKPAENAMPADVAELIQTIQSKTRIAKGGDNKNATFFNAQMRDAWNAEHPCRSRYEIRALYALRTNTEDVADNPTWRSVYKAYEELHRTCVLQMGNITEFFLNRRHIEGCHFVVAGVEPGAGLGNKVLSIVSAMVYAVLTQRVLLVPVATAVPGVFCEPFEGSSWEIDPDKVWSDETTSGDLWISIQELYDRIDNSRGGNHNAMIEPVYASGTTERWDFQPQPRFFCDTEQAQYSQVNWIGFRNNLYYVPKLFAIPSFRPLLENLFPDRTVLTHLLRTLMLPQDSVWGRVKQVHDTHFRHAHRRVGVQIRYFRGITDFTAIHKEVEDHFEQCLLQNHFLPDPNPNPSRVTKIPPPSSHTSNLANSATIDPMPPLNVTTVLVTSLYQGMSERLTKDYVRTWLDSGDAVAVVQLTHEGDQFFSEEVDRQALVEILSLSFTDHLVLTPLSTFGALAQGYGALTPWYVDRWAQTPTPCVRALSPEVCYQIPASKHFICAHDVAVNGKAMTDVVPYLSDCHPAVEDPFFKVNSAGLGMQLLVTPRPA